MKGIQHRHTAKCSGIRGQQVLLDEKSRTFSGVYTMTAVLVMVCAPVAGVRVVSCCRCPWQPQRFSLVGYRSLERALVPAPFHVGPPSISHEKTKFILTVFGIGIKTINLNPSLPRSSTLDLPPVLPSNPAS